MGETVYVAATVEGQSADLYLLDRSERTIVDRAFDVVGLHWTWRDGQKPHLRAESGDLANTQMHATLVEGIRETWGNARLWAAGAYRRWDEVPEIYQTGSRIYHADEVGNFPPAKRRDRVIEVELGPREHVEVAHYLVRPGPAATEFIEQKRSSPDVQLVCIDTWSPWSVVTTWRFDDRSFLRSSPTDIVVLPTSG